MLNLFRKVFKKAYINRLKRRGLLVGKNFQMEKGCNIDANFPWLITIGDNVTFSSNVIVLAHDGSTKKICGKSKVGKVTISDNVFVGINALIFPNVTVGENSIIGAGSVVTKSIPANVVVAGNPARVLCSLNDFEKRNHELMSKLPRYEIEYTNRGHISSERKEKMKKELKEDGGYII